jgi:hypothetical protein
LASVVVFQLKEYGDELSVEASAPSTHNSTRVTPTLSLALAVTVVVPLTFAPAAGEVIDVAGASVSGAGPLLTDTVTVVDCPTLFAASYARDCSVWLPFASVVVFQLKLYGDALSVNASAPSIQSSTRVTPTLSVAVAVTSVVALTLVPFPGLVIAVVGG